MEVSDLKDEIEGLTTRLKKYDDDIVALNQDIEAKKNKIDEAQAAITRYKGQLNDVKNNREYDTLSKEIEFQTLEVELLNKRIGEAQKAIAGKENDIANCKNKLEERRADLGVKESELDEITAETKAEEERLREKHRRWSSPSNRACFLPSSASAITHTMVWASFT